MIFLATNYVNMVVVVAGHPFPLGLAIFRHRIEALRGFRVFKFGNDNLPS